MVSSETVMQVLQLLQNMIVGVGEVKKEDLVELYDSIKSSVELSIPLNLEATVMSDTRFSAETNKALLSLIGNQPYTLPPGSTGYCSRASISTFPQQHVLSQAQNCWNFNPFNLKMPHPLATLAMYLMTGEQLVKRLRLDRQKLFNFLCAIESKYNSAHYHNAYHACAVLQCMHMLLVAGGVKDACCLDDQSLLACYVAALAHDVGHKGLTNDFLIRSGDDLAIMYNDMSPLENFHASECIKTMRAQNCDFIQAESSVDYVSCKALIIKLIMATDIKCHFQLLSLFANTDPSLDCGPCLQMTIKCADLSHLSSPLSLHKQWVHRLEEEFLKQGDVERLKGMPVGPMMDRTKPTKLSDTQIGFFEKVAVPMFSMMAERHQQSQPMLTSCLHNLQAWQSDL